MALPLELPISDNEVSFSERSFLPFTEANHVFIIHKNRPESEEGLDASLSIHTCLINTYGRMQFVEENQVVFLPILLGDLSLPSGHSIELACADVAEDDSDDCLAVLATVWVELNEHFCPCRHFGALFVISSALLVRMSGKTNDLSSVAHCRLTDKIFDSEREKYWILYEASECLSVYRIDEDLNLSCSVDMHNLFPELERLELPGVVTRSSSISTGKLYWSAIGFDTGHVVLSVFCVESQNLCRKLIKFSGPISVLIFLHPSPLDAQKYAKESDINYQNEEFLVISSTLGPVAVWKCFYEADMLSWNNDFFLSQSEQFDTITSACIVDDNIAIGTYSGKILFYSSNCDLASHEIISMTKIHAPVVSVKVLNRSAFYVLSTAGLHTVTRPCIGPL